MAVSDLTLKLTPPQPAVSQPWLFQWLRWRVVHDAYGLVFHVPWFYYALLPVFFAGFLLLPGSLGALACFLIVNITPQRRRQVLAAVLAAVVVGGVYWAYATFREMRHPQSSRDAL